MLHGMALGDASDEAVDQADFSQVVLPGLDRPVLRMGVASNYGLQTADIHHAAERGVNCWFWSHRFKTATPALKELLAADRQRHVVMVTDMAWTAGSVRRGVERARRLLGIDQLDLYMLGWLGKASLFGAGIQRTLVQLRQEGLVQAVGCSIHDRARAGALARDSVLDALMIRYSAKHPGAEQDIFPHLEQRRPIIAAYTAASWGQLLRPIQGLGAPLTPAQCYRFCLSSPHVHVVFTGPKTRAQLDENLDSLEQGQLVGEEMARVRAYGREVKSRKKLPFV
jgi:aryl-alcohol dehydrogenase-like predicted oxidoreductase